MSGVPPGTSLDSALYPGVLLNVKARVYFLPRLESTQRGKRNGKEHTEGEESNFGLWFTAKPDAMNKILKLLVGPQRVERRARKD